MTDRQSREHDTPFKGTELTDNAIIVVGAGVVGCTLALQCAAQGLDVLLLDATAPNHRQKHVGFDSRSIALSFDTYQSLRHLGLSVEQCTSAITHIHVSDQGHLGKTNLSADTYNVSALGYVAELAILGEQLHDAIQAEPKIQWRREATVTHLEQTREQITVTVNDKERWAARLVVAADGGQSSIREMLALPSHEKSYQQVALIANIGIEKPHQGHAFERFTSTGPLAMLPLQTLDGQHRCSLVWCLEQCDSKRLKMASPTDFLMALQREFGTKLGTLQKVGERVTYPLSLITNDFPQQHRVLFVGNASQSIHPIAGQGFNLAMRDCHRLSEHLGLARREHKDLGDPQGLINFQRERQADRRQVITTTDNLVTLFSNQYLPMVIARNLGLMAMQHLSPVKHWFGQQMMGLKQQ